MGLSGLEPPTSRLSGVRSNHLSYKPASVCVRKVIPFPLLSFVLTAETLNSCCAHTLAFVKTFMCNHLSY